MGGAEGVPPAKAGAAVQGFGYAALKRRSTRSGWITLKLRLL